MRAYGITNAAPAASAPAVGAAGDTYFNSTSKILYVSDGTAWIAIDTQLWSDTGTVLTPGPNVTTRPLALAGAKPTVVVAGTRTAKGRLVVDGNAERARLTLNASLNAAETTWALDDTAKPAWLVSLDAVGDQCTVARMAPSTGTFSFPLALDSAGNLAAAGGISTGGATTAYTNPGIRVTGATAGLRCQSVGTAGADGYSNAIGFGWDGSLKARIDATVIGTVSVTSDQRLKLAVQADVPGLDAVLAMQPISFEYDQTKRAIGFPKGRHYGLIAQEVEPHAPLVVAEDDSAEHWKEIDYRALVPVLINAVKELTARVAELEARHGDDATPA